VAEPTSASEEVLASRADPMMSSCRALFVAAVLSFSSEGSWVDGNVIAAGGPFAAFLGLATEASFERSPRPTLAATAENTTRVPADRMARQTPMAEASPPLVKMVLRMLMPP
jgi:hypothetical protein